MESENPSMVKPEISEEAFQKKIPFWKNRKQLIIIIFLLLVLLSLTSISAYHYYNSSQQSPLEQEQKQQVIDDLAAKDMQSLQEEIKQYVQEKGQLPKDLNAVLALVNPELKENLQQDIKEYQVTYQVKNETIYELCATFYTDTTKKAYKGLFGEPLPSNPIMNHPKGKSCFEFTEVKPQPSPSEDSASQ